MGSGQAENETEREELAVQIVNEYVFGRWPKKRQMVESVAEFLAKGWAPESIRKAADNWRRAYEHDPQRVFGSEDGLLHFFNWQPPEPSPSPVPMPAPKPAVPPQTQDTQDPQASQATQDSQDLQEKQDPHHPRPAGEPSLEEEEAAEEEPVDLTASALYSQRYPEDYEIRRIEAEELLRELDLGEWLRPSAAEAIADAIPDSEQEVEFGDETTAAAFVFARRFLVGMSAFRDNNQTRILTQTGMMMVAKAWCTVWEDYGDYDPEDIAIELFGALGKARHVAGSDGTFKTGIKEAAERSETPLSLKGVEANGFHSVALLGKICKVLSAARARAGYATFFLSCRDAGDLTGKGKDKAQKMFLQLCEAKVIEKIRTGTQRPGGGDATEWKYVGNDDPPEPEKKGGKKPR